MDSCLAKELYNNLKNAFKVLVRSTLEYAPGPLYLAKHIHTNHTGQRRALPLICGPEEASVYGKNGGIEVGIL